MYNRPTHLFAVISLTLLGSSALPPAPPAQISWDDCFGCRGGSGGGTAQGANCGQGIVTITVDVSDGQCWESWLGDCLWLPCRATVIRTWAHLPDDTELQFCRTASGTTWCLDPPPTTGPSGAGSSTIPGSPIPCGENEQFSISHGCGLTATAPGACGVCE